MKKKLLLILFALLLASLCLVACTPADKPDDPAPTPECEHEWISAIIVQPTCSAEGVERFLCKKCNTFRDEPVQKLEHEAGESLEVPATCYQEGVSAGTKCINCGAIMSGCEPIPKTAHTMEPVAGCAAGSTGSYYACTVCGQYFASESGGDPLPESWTPSLHEWSFAQGKCLNCNKAVSSVEQALKENYSIANSARLASATPQNVVVAAGYAYYYQREQIYYDQHIYRRNYAVNPEDATAFNQLYLDCSSYVNVVYNYAFGKKLSTNPKTATFTDYCSSNVGSPEVLFFVNTANYKTKAAQAQLLAEIRSQLQLGDLIVYRHGKSSASSGHIMMYIGNNKLLHSAGSSMTASAGGNPNNFYEKVSSAEKTGTVMELSAEALFNPANGSNRYLFGSSAEDTVYTFGVFRPIGNRVGFDQVTASALCRYAYQRLELEKTCSVNSVQSVQKGDTITYTVNIKNAGTQAYKGVYVKESLPAGTQFVSASDGYHKQGNVLYFTLPQIDGGKSFKVTYTVKITADKGTEIVDDGTYVNDIKLNTVYHTVESTYNRAEFAAKLKATIGKKFDLRKNFLSAVYSDSAVTFLTANCAKVADVIGDVYTSGKLNSASKIAPYMVRGMFGGLNVGKNYSQNDVRARVVQSAKLQCGDIIVADTTYSENGESIRRQYYFVDENTIVTYKDKHVVVACGTKEEVDKFLVTLYAYNAYTIIRPTLI